MTLEEHIENTRNRVTGGSVDAETLDILLEMMGLFHSMNVRLKYLEARGRSCR